MLDLHKGNIIQSQARKASVSSRRILGDPVEFRFMFRNKTVGKFIYSYGSVINYEIYNKDLLPYDLQLFQTVMPFEEAILFALEAREARVAMYRDLTRCGWHMDPCETFSGYDLCWVCRSSDKPLYMDLLEEFKERHGAKDVLTDPYTIAAILVRNAAVANAVDGYQVSVGGGIVKSQGMEWFSTTEQAHLISKSIENKGIVESRDFLVNFYGKFRYLNPNTIYRAYNFNGNGDLCWYPLEERIPTFDRIAPMPDDEDFKRDMNEVELLSIKEILMPIYNNSKGLKLKLALEHYFKLEDAYRQSQT